MMNISQTLLPQMIEEFKEKLGVNAALLAIGSSGFTVKILEQIPGLDGATANNTIHLITANIESHALLILAICSVFIIHTCYKKARDFYGMRTRIKEEFTKLVGNALTEDDFKDLSCDLEEEMTTPPKRFSSDEKGHLHGLRRAEKRRALKAWKNLPASLPFTDVSNVARTEENFADWLEKQDYVVQLWNHVGGQFGGAHLRLDLIYLDNNGNFVGMEMKIHKSDDHRKPIPKDTILRHLIDAGFLDENEIECTHYPSFNCAIFEWRPSQEVVKILGLQSNEEE